MEKDEAFLKSIVENLVEKPEAIVITRIIDEMGVFLTLTVDKDDMGKVIGKMGATAKAIRTLLRVVGMRYNARVNLKINEPEGGLRSGEMMGMNEEESGGSDNGSYEHKSNPIARAERSVDDVLHELAL